MPNAMRKTLAKDTWTRNKFLIVTPFTRRRRRERERDGERERAGMKGKGVGLIRGFPFLSDSKRNLEEKRRELSFNIYNLPPKSNGYKL
ncbi:hypothetical protein GBA52_026560 [Prunus armeniaca]|nr:hypothetical protein GBA52_026560 [Prunus armeniaca]